PSFFARHEGAHKGRPYDPLLRLMTSAAHQPALRLSGSLTLIEEKLWQLVPGWVVLVKSRFVAAIFFCVMAATAHAQTQYFHEFYAFGDSLSDNGRIPRLTGRPVTNGPLYYGGRFSHRPLYPALRPRPLRRPHPGDNDFAVGGAVSGYANKPVPQFTDQIDQFIASGRPVSPRDVFGMWIGYNDFAQPAALTEPDRVVSNLLANITSAINRLGAIGGR